MDGARATIAADRGWQSTGFRVEEDKTYLLTAEGRYTVAEEPRPWPCEPDGVTIRYAKGHPLGVLLAGVSQLDEDVVVPYTPLAEPTAIGRSGHFTPKHSGTLYLKINEPSAGLADNAGELTVTVTAEP
jgi:hypothetical protein